MMSKWTRTEDGIWSRDGWRIEKIRFNGTGQAKPFGRVSVKARTAWVVSDPQGVPRTESATVSGAKANADRQIAIRAARV
jgi:hypothetical protein